MFIFIPDLFLTVSAASFGYLFALWRTNLLEALYNTPDATGTELPVSNFY